MVEERRKHHRKRQDKDPETRARSPTPRRQRDVPVEDSKKSSTKSRRRATDAVDDKAGVPPDPKPPELVHRTSRKAKEDEKTKQHTSLKTKKERDKSSKRGEGSQTEANQKEDKPSRKEDKSTRKEDKPTRKEDKSSRKEDKPRKRDVSVARVDSKRREGSPSRKDDARRKGTEDAKKSSRRKDDSKRSSSRKARDRHEDPEATKKGKATEQERRRQPKESSQDRQEATQDPAIKKEKPDKESSNHRDGSSSRKHTTKDKEKRSSRHVRLSSPPARSKSPDKNKSVSTSKVDDGVLNLDTHSNIFPYFNSDIEKDIGVRISIQNCLFGKIADKGNPKASHRACYLLFKVSVKNPKAAEQVTISLGHMAAHQAARRRPIAHHYSGIQRAGEGQVVKHMESQRAFHVDLNAVNAASGGLSLSSGENYDRKHAITAEVVKDTASGHNSNIGKLDFIVAGAPEVNLAVPHSFCIWTFLECKEGKGLKVVFDVKRGPTNSFMQKLKFWGGSVRAGGGGSFDEHTTTWWEVKPRKKPGDSCNDEVDNVFKVAEANPTPGLLVEG